MIDITGKYAIVRRDGNHPWRLVWPQNGEFVRGGTVPVNTYGLLTDRASSIIYAKILAERTGYTYRVCRLRTNWIGTAPYAKIPVYIAKPGKRHSR